ncbi:reverse transcriptase domain-containing protein [Tanacetum coccineum]
MSSDLLRGGPLEINVETPLDGAVISAREQIEGHLSALRSLLKEHNGRGSVSPIRLSFDDTKDQPRVQTVVTGTVVDADLNKPFKEAVKTPLTRRIIEFAGPEFKMPANIRLYDGATDREDHLSRFSFAANSGEWPMPVWCQRWIVETGFITGVPEVMKISSFMDAHKCPKLAKRFSDKVPKTVDEMMARLDDFVRSEEAFTSIELPKGEVSEASKKSMVSYHAPVPYQAHRDQGSQRPRFNLSSLTKLPKEILAMEPQLNLQLPRPMQLPPKKENQDRYCDYHGEKGHYPNDCFQLRRQLEMALESWKLNHLVKDVRQRGRGNAKGRDAGKDKVINMIRGLARGNVRTLIRKLESRDEVAVEEHTDGSSRFRQGSSEALGKDRDGFKSPQGSVLNYTLHDEISHPERYRNPGHADCGYCLMPKAGEEANGGNLSEECKSQLRKLLKKSMDVFAWEPADMTGVPKRIIEYSLNVNPLIEPAAQKRIVMAADRTQADGSWRMCIDFKNLNSVCLKDYYPLPDIDGKIESVVGFRYKCFLDAYKGYHKVQMAQEDEEKMTFYTGRDTYCYTKMPFGLKNTGATYQRLVDTAFQSQIGRNLEAYVDDMVIKSNDKKMLIADITETFNNLRKINMKLNPKKCSFGVEEGKFLGYMVTSEGIRANPKKTKAIADMQSPQTLKEMQSLSGKLAALKRFLSRSAEKSLPLLKDITKENKDEYRWTESAEKAFQEMKQCIVGLPLLTTPGKEETLYVYLAASTEAVSAVLLTKRKGKQCLIHYVSMTLNEANRNYAPMEKIGPIIVAHVTEITKVLRSPPYQGHNGSAAKAYIEQVPSIRETRQILDEIRSVQYSVRTKKCHKRAVEYEALLAGLRMSKKMNIKDIDVKVDSKLVASQINGSYVASITSMIKYLATAKECIAGFRSFVIQNIPRNLNQKADILSKLATHAFDHLTKKVLVKVLAERSTDRKEISVVVEEEEDDWMTPIIRCLAEGVCPEDKKERRALRMKINQPPASDLWKTKIRHRSHRLLYEIDRSEAVGQNHGEDVKKFVWDNIVCRFGLPRANGLVERANKSLMEGIKARLGRERAGWVYELPNVLWAHRTSLKQSNGETPFSLTYGSEAVIPAEIGMPTHRTMMIKEDKNEDELRLNMDLLQERREAATIRETKYKTKIEQYYNQKVRLTSFKPDEYVFRKN